MTAKGSNKALLFKDIKFIKIHSLQDPRQNTIIINVNLKHIKNKEKDRKP